MDDLNNIAAIDDQDASYDPPPRWRRCVLYEFVLRKYAPTLEFLAENGVPVLFVGAGGVDYSPETRKHVSDILDGLNTVGLITRDEAAYDAYAGHFQSAYQGIDCGFFIDDWHSPVEADAFFTLATFDKREEPPIPGAGRIIRPTHTPFSDTSPFVGLVKKLVPALDHRGPSNLLESEDTFLSDSLEDYLFLYANGIETHSDGIHACVPALAYGNRVRFYYYTPRAGLFDEVLSEDITARSVSVAPERLREKKEQQIARLEELIERAV